MDNNFEPQQGDTSFSIPVTFGYKGGRASNVKNKIVTVLVFIGVAIVGTIICLKNDNFELWQKVLYSIICVYGSLLVIRFLGLKELYFSDMFEETKARNGLLKPNTIWGIFDISTTYPYTCFFKNGYKGIFVRMERDTITGKDSDADYFHYTAIGDAYNLAHALNMNIVHIDYMDNVGNDPRMEKLYADLNNVSNPDMQDMLVDIYDNLSSIMKMNYTSFDVYLFLTRDKLDSLVYNVQSVVNTMLGGNFISYKVLDRIEVANICPALFNLEDFSFIEACESVLDSQGNRGIIPIKIIKSDGTEEKLNKTQEEKKRDLELKAKQLEDAKAERRRRKANKKFKIDEDTVDIGKDEELDLFGSSDKDDFNLL
jgi:hypothetical protein